MTNRSINFEAVQNVRDLGGLKTTDGRFIVSGRLLRSANLAEATEKDQKILCEEYHLAKIIDLRTGMERKEKSDAAMATVESISIPIFDESIAGISHEKNISKEEMLARIPQMGQLYGKMVTEESCRKNLGKAARCVMEHDFSKGSVLWHCTEGKDRCGLLSATLLLALGVDRSTIMEDYLLTNEVNGPKAEKYYQMALSAGKTEAAAAVVRDIFLAKEEYLNGAFRVIDEQYGNAVAFLRDGLGIPERLIERFQESMLQ